ncbi:MAG: arsenate reductase ArsC [Endozoicomonas sp.]
MTTTKILFLCTGNSCRSQMAEGWARALLGEQFDIYSAGIEAHGLNPKAITVMKEAGVDISHHRSQTLAELDHDSFDYIFTVCDHARKTCPTPKQGKVILHQFDDPPRLSARAESEEEALSIYRRVRDEIKFWVEQLPEQISAPAGP